MLTLEKNVKKNFSLTHYCFYCFCFSFGVDNAYACDPRIKKFKDEEKEKKLAEKRAKEEAARAVAEEKERVS